MLYIVCVLTYLCSESVALSCIFSLNLCYCYKINIALLHPIDAEGPEC